MVEAAELVCWNGSELSGSLLSEQWVGSSRLSPHIRQDILEPGVCFVKRISSFGLIRIDDGVCNDDSNISGILRELRRLSRCYLGNECQLHGDLGQAVPAPARYYDRIPQPSCLPG